MKVVYRYTDQNDGIVKYIGIVFGDSRTLEQRVKEHTKDEWYSLGMWKIDFFTEGLETRNDCEVWEAHLIARYGTDKWYNKAKITWGMCRYLPEEPKWNNYIIETAESKINFVNNCKEGNTNHAIELSDNAIKAFRELYRFVNALGNVFVYEDAILTKSETIHLIEFFNSACDGESAIEELIENRILYVRNAKRMSEDGTCLVLKKVFYNYLLTKVYTEKELMDIYKKSWTFNMYDLYYRLLPCISSVDDIAICNGEIVSEGELGSICDMPQEDAVEAMNRLMALKVFKKTILGYRLVDKKMKTIPFIMQVSNMVALSPSEEN